MIEDPSVGYRLPTTASRVSLYICEEGCIYIHLDSYNKGQALDRMQHDGRCCGVWPVPERLSEAEREGAVTEVSGPSFLIDISDLPILQRRSLRLFGDWPKAKYRNTYFHIINHAVMRVLNRR